MNATKRRLAAFTKLEWVVIAGIAAVLIALVTPQAEWVADGSIQLPVRVVVFDVANPGTRLANAKVVILRGPLASEPQSHAEMQARMASDPISDWSPQDVVTTDETGSVVIRHEFPTGASNKRPTRRAFLNIRWVAVDAQGYRPAIVPVSQEPEPTAKLRQQGEILVRVGLNAITN